MTQRRRTRRPAAAATPPAQPAQREPDTSHLAGAGPSRVGVVGALRARDVDRPSPEDLDEARRTLQIVRTGWRPDAR